MTQFPITEIRSFNLLNSNEPTPVATTATATQSTVTGNVLTVAGTVTGVFEPGQTVTGNGIPALTTILSLGTGTGNTGTYIISRSLSLTARLVTATTGWNQSVADLTVLSYQNLDLVNLGYRYLVLSNSSQGGRWTVNEVVVDNANAQRTTQIVQIQNYNTALYWNYIDWFRPGYNSSTQPVVQVANSAALQTLSVSTVPVGASVKVVANGNGKFEIYTRTPTDWERVGLEDGTIAFDSVLWNYALGPYGYDAEVFDAQYFDQEPAVETRKIIQAINQELFIDDLLLYRNQLLVLIFKYIYSEFASPDWLIKTSFIDVDHNLRALLPYQLYLRDNQTFVEQYLQEVKPFHVQTLAFNLIYNGLDIYPGLMTDFDVPAYYNTNLQIPQFVSPVLTPYSLANSRTESTISDAQPNQGIWAQHPWNSWFNNHTLGVTSVAVLSGGSNYVLVPDVTFGTEWTANTVYTVGQQLNYINGHQNNLYTVTASGTSGSTPPLFVSDSAVNGTITLSYAGSGANGTAVLAHTIGNVAVTGTYGQFSCTADTLAVGTIIEISGTLSGTATIATYPDTTTYYVTATNATTTFTLSAEPGGTAIVTTAGSTTGLTFQIFGYDQVVAVNITDPGTGYVSTTTVNFPSTTINGSAVVVALQEAAAGQQPAASLFVTTTVAGRPLGDVTNSGTVTVADSVQYQKWTNGITIPVGETAWIEQTMNPTMLSNTAYADYYNGVAVALPVMTNNLVRNFAITLKFDRCQYATDIFEWAAGTSYAQDAQVRYRNQVWQANQAVTSAVFDPAQWTLVDADTLSGVDRTMGYYTPTSNMPGLSLPLLITGVSYPGVQVDAPNFDQDSGFDVGGFDNNPFDNVFIGPEGRPTYDPGILDSAIQSSYLDPFVGISANNIQINGGGFQDVATNYAPEELVAGSEFDTLDFRVYTTGGPTDGADFRIFQDMRQLQSTYVITALSSTFLDQTLSPTADIIYVANTDALATPDLARNLLGVVTINAERIMYRQIDHNANTVSGLIRGTAGTAITEHTVELLANVVITGTAGQFSCATTNNALIAEQLVVITGTNIGTGSITGYTSPSTYRISMTNGSNTFVLQNTDGTPIVTTTGTPFGLTYDRTCPVLNISASNLLGQQFQNFTVQHSVVADGATVVFAAPNITLSTSTVAWSSANSYNSGDIVDDSGSFYTAIQNVPVSTTITNTAYWQPLSVAVEVYVGGLQISADTYTVTAQAPVSVTLDLAPTLGVMVTILVRRGRWIFY